MFWVYAVPYLVIAGILIGVGALRYPKAWKGEESVVIIMAGLAWPVTIPLVLGLCLAGWVNRRLP